MVKHYIRTRLLIDKWFTLRVHFGEPVQFNNNEFSCFLELS